MKLLVIFVLVLLGGCASNSGVIALGNDSFIINEQAATGFNGTGGIENDALREAAKKCHSTGMTMKITSLTKSKPPYILGNYPTVQLKFVCVVKNEQSQ